MPPKTPEGKQRALANLKRGGRRRPPVPKELSALELKIATLTPSSPAVRRIVKELLAAQSALIEPQPQDAPMLALFAMTLQVARLAAADLAQHGITTRDGTDQRPAVKVFLEATKRAAELADRLGFSPVVRAKLGLGSNQASEFARLLAELPKTEDSQG